MLVILVTIGMHINSVLLPSLSSLITPNIFIIKLDILKLARASDPAATNYSS